MFRRPSDYPVYGQARIGWEPSEEQQERVRYEAERLEQQFFEKLRQEAVKPIGLRGRYFAIHDEVMGRLRGAWQHLRHGYCEDI